ncbi:hypothetical protein QPK32_25860 [Massilia sp. YIM B02763]|uniref:hypothetical protein n=1 Tax=Massilia sp. YIM B02763 TaxID=3050130 RepID=UPI0025B6D1BA|nr:hypothetical protein [Massilia sp. YIM B02763]MDN4056488.1 hypothetical protein [Massilia sp. YIM B02763]
MGHSLSWFAVSGQDAAALLDELQLVRTGQTTDHPGRGIHCATLPDGAFMLHIDDVDSRLTAAPFLKTLSAKGQVILCRAEEHVMFSTVACYRRGELAWSVEHDAQQDICHLAIVGDAPPEAAAMRAAALAEHDQGPCGDADTDYMFDVPIRLAEMMTSFSHDAGLRVPRADAFELLHALQPLPRRPWWKLW